MGHQIFFKKLLREADSKNMIQLEEFFKAIMLSPK